MASVIGQCVNKPLINVDVPSFGKQTIFITSLTLNDLPS